MEFKKDNLWQDTRIVRLIWWNEHHFAKYHIMTASIDQPRVISWYSRTLLLFIVTSFWQLTIIPILLLTIISISYIFFSRRLAMFVQKWLPTCRLVSLQWQWTGFQVAFQHEIIFKRNFHCVILFLQKDRPSSLSTRFSLDFFSYEVIKIK